MEIFKKKKLLCFLFLFFAFVPFINVYADYDITLKNGENLVFPDKPEDGNDTFYIFKSNATGKYYLFDISSNYSDRVMVFNYINSNDTFYLGFTYSEESIPSGTRVNQYVYNESSNSWNYLRDTSCTGDCYFVDTTSYKFTASQLLYSSVDVYTKQNSIIVNSIDTNLPMGEYAPYSLIFESNIVSLETKKEFLYNNQEMTNPIKYIDLYFAKEDLGKKINFELQINDYFDYDSCSYCDYLNIEKFEFSYLIKDDNGLYKWIDLSNNDTGVYFDYIGDIFPRNEDGTGFTLSGIINLAYDSANFEFEQIRVSIKLSNAYNFKYTYSDNSNLVFNNIDEYYHYMIYDSDKRLNRIVGGSTKYIILSTTQEEIKASLLVEYINTTKYLYVEYFDTFTRSYMENGMIYSFDNYLIENRDIEKFDFSIGTKNARGIYLMNYLYQKEGENLDSKYYFYIPTEIVYSSTDYLEEAVFYDSDTNLNDSINSNPNYETDYISFIDNFRIIYNFLEDLQATSDTFNYMWDSFYNTMPSMLQIFLKFVTHILCVLMFMKIVGYD